MSDSQVTLTPKTTKIPKFKYPLVCIDWKDATTHNDWLDIKDLQKEVGVYTTLTVGFLLKEDDEAFYIASTYFEDMCNAQITIPKGMVRNIFWGRFAPPNKSKKKKEKEIEVK
jgi:hypothetical protein